MEKILLVGTGEVAERITGFIRRYHLFEIVGYSVNEEYLKQDRYLDDLPVYPLEHLEDYINPEDVKCFVAMSWFHYLNKARDEVYRYLKDKGFSFANIISPHAMCWSNSIGEGNWICDGVSAEESTIIGNNSVIDGLVFLGHHTQIGDSCFIAANTVVGGHSQIGDRTFVGIGSVIFNDITIGNKCIVGGGTVVKHNLHNYSVCKTGNDAVIIKQYDENSIEYKLTPGYYKK